VSTLALSLLAFAQRRDDKLRKELSDPFGKWLTEDVAYIISDEERRAWKLLATADEREQFIEQFWLRRDPTPDTVENEFKEEHYRRIGYANERFASGVPGWKTDRGRIYITFGPPDEIESHPSGGSYQRPPEEGGGVTSTYPFELWRYRWIEDIGTDIVIEFVDPTMTGEYRRTIDPSEKNALLHVPGASQPQNRMTGTARMNPFDRLEQSANLDRPRRVKFTDLQASVDSVIKFNVLPMQAQADFFPLTESSVMTHITVQLENKDLQFQAKDGQQKAVVRLYGRIATMTRRVANVFEDTVTADSPAGLSIYQKAVPLAPGQYRLNLVLQDAVGGAMNNYELALHVPRFETGVLSASSLILADLISRTPARSIGAGAFVIGGTKVRPRLSRSFRRDETMGIFLQVYNFTGGSIDYEIATYGSGEKALAFSEDVSARQVTIERLLPLADLKPGRYTLKMKITDRAGNQTLTPTATFNVI